MWFKWEKKKKNNVSNYSRRFSAPLFIFFEFSFSHESSARSNHMRSVRQWWAGDEVGLACLPNLSPGEHDIKLISRSALSLERERREKNRYLNCVWPALQSRQSSAPHRLSWLARSGGWQQRREREALTSYYFSVLFLDVINVHTRVAWKEHAAERKVVDRDPTPHEDFPRCNSSWL